MKNTLARFFLSLGLLLLATVVFANEEATSQAAESISWIDWTYQNIVFILGGLIVLGGVMGIVRLNSQLLELQKMRLLQEHGIETMEKLDLVSKESAWDRWVKNMTKAVPVEKEEDVMLDHDYDGIRELDNILPPWWVSLFNITIVIGVIYFGYFHLTDYGYTGVDEWEWEMEAAEESVKAYLSTQADLVDENTVVALLDAADLAEGNKIYTTNCKICHGEHGEGGIGPNFADEYWIHGGDVKDVFRTIKYGANNGMISWKSQLKASEMQKVASYLLTFQGTNPPGAKDPQGELWVAPKTQETEEEADVEQAIME